MIPVLDCVENTNIKIGAQNIYFEDQGAYTGEISAKMLKESGVEYVIIGHSERRNLFNESDLIINKKIIKALEYGLIPILCVGEDLSQRENNITIEFIRMQIKLALKNINQDGALCTIAPTILKLMNLDIPKEMTGEPLI